MPPSRPRARGSRSSARRCGPPSSSLSLWSLRSLTFQSRALVGEDLHEVREPRDLEDLAVVVAESRRPDRAAVLPRTGEDPDDERDPRAGEELDTAEVQQ